MEIVIDEKSGYCFGVEFAIQMAEDEIKESGTLYCLGDIVHNSMEVKRLYEKGLRFIDREQLKTLKNSKVLIRAHGEPPETYRIAIENNLELIDASCPVVLKLQNRIKHAYDRARQKNGQIVIYGKDQHPEVIGLNGQIDNQAIVVSDESELNGIDFHRPIFLFSQTTKSTEGFYKLKSAIEQRMKEELQLEEISEEWLDVNDSICRQVSNREPQMARFAQQVDVVIFVSGKKSSNGRALYQVCLHHNPRSYFVENELEIEPSWIQSSDKVGICGATSTPMWLMKQVADYIQKMFV
ncbi:MAG: 4-hydroxy-3-methylbut-2-enyl diphosphate reductase [Cytophagales bacterium]|nr:4-hydroxy-3-methylbut-2-enyl diphosphate reductase [Cytophagales bacterium]MDW8383732.1 4-hydroxy-3-methylbut-2-enyl diphosphate reductase [Flammeovirgaceae bacterium]